MNDEEKEELKKLRNNEAKEITKKIKISDEDKEKYRNHTLTPIEVYALQRVQTFENKYFFRVLITILESHQCLDKNDLDILTSQDECRKRFHIGYPILYEKNDLPVDEDRYYHNEDKELELPLLLPKFLGKQYYVTNQAYGLLPNCEELSDKKKDQRTPFYIWVLNHIYKETVLEDKDTVYKPFYPESDTEQTDISASPVSISGPYENNHNQKIYYGVPGSGKSNKIKEETKDIDESQKIRVVFHPDYCNADFIGQILPKTAGGGISYEFKPGPFAKILWRAYHNPSKKYYLIIEEINRGNAAAIFGDAFQLLDRFNSENEIDKDEISKKQNYTVGWSSYFIENADLNNYIRSNYEFGSSNYSDKDHPSTVAFDNISFTENSGVRLPPNLSLLATMNTSDQNVFTLDNAFQRRWDMELIPNDLSEKSDKNQYNMTIHCTLNNTPVIWGKFRDGINNFINEEFDNSGFSSTEDSQLGSYFIHNEGNEISARDFCYKVIKYLWDDVFRTDREQAFKNKGSFETAIIDKIENDTLKLEDIFKPIVFGKISGTVDTEESSNETQSEEK